MLDTVAIVGASANRQKYGNKAVRAYHNRGWRVFPVNPHEKKIENLPVYKTLLEIKQPIKRVSVYLPPTAGLKILPQIAAVKPKEVFINPGAESEELIKKAEELKLPIVVSCSILEIGETPAKY